MAAEVNKINWSTTFNKGETICNMSKMFVHFSVSYVEVRRQIKITNFMKATPISVANAWAKEVRRAKKSWAALKEFARSVKITKSRETPSREFATWYWFIYNRHLAAIRQVDVLSRSFLHNNLAFWHHKRNSYDVSIRGSSEISDTKVFLSEKVLLLGFWIFRVRKRIEWPCKM